MSGLAVSDEGASAMVRNRFPTRRKPVVGNRFPTLKASETVGNCQKLFFYGFKHIKYYLAICYIVLSVLLIYETPSGYDVVYSTYFLTKSRSNLVLAFMA